MKPSFWRRIPGQWQYILRIIARRADWWESAARNLRFAWRALRRAPGFAITTVLTVALAVGAVTVMFSLVNGVLLRSLPFAAEDRLVWVVNRGVRPYDAVSPVDLADWREQTHSFAAMGGYIQSTANLTGGKDPVRLATADVTSNWFAVLGVQMTLGRGFVSSEEGVGAPKVVVLSDALWRTQFGADRGVLDRTILLDGAPYTVIGVAPRAFTFPERPDLWRPVALAPALLTARGGRRFWGPVARLKPGITLGQARADLHAIAERLRVQYPDAETGLSYDLVPLRQHVVGNARTALVVLLGAVACLLLIACANIATLLLLRATSRSTEMGIRVALGARPRRIVVQLLGESLLLALLGGAGGVLIAEWGVHALVLAAIDKLPLVESVVVDGRVLAFALAITVGTGLLFGLLPALHASGADATVALQLGTRGASARRGTSRLRNVLVIAEVALAVPLLIGATLLGKSFVRLLDVSPGFRAEQVVRFDVNLPYCAKGSEGDSVVVPGRGRCYASPAAFRTFTNELVRGLQAQPGTQAAAAGFGVPFTEWASNQTIVAIDGRPASAMDHPNSAESKYVTPEYFAALGIPVLRGRAFSESDNPTAQRVVVVSKAFADTYISGEDPIGKVVHDYGAIVGVVGDTKAYHLGSAPEPAIYQAWDQVTPPWMTIVIRSTAEPGAVMAAARKQVASLDQSLPVYHMMRMEDAVVAAAGAPRLEAWVVGGFSATALLLAVIGIYGLIAYAVGERRRELGIRIALGAEPQRVVRLFVGEGIRLVAIGVGIGGAVAVAASGALRSLLFGIGPTDVFSYGEVCAVFIGVALIASWLPARRAAQVDPMDALRAV
jgi:putative ABC transport system permease protein